MRPSTEPLRLTGFETGFVRFAGGCEWAGCGRLGALRGACGRGWAAFFFAGLCGRGALALPATCGCGRDSSLDDAASAWVAARDAVGCTASAASVAGGAGVAVGGVELGAGVECGAGVERGAGAE